MTTTTEVHYEVLYRRDAKSAWLLFGVMMKDGVDTIEDAHEQLAYVRSVYAHYESKIEKVSITRELVEVMADDEDLTEALDAIEEVMCADKGQSEDEWIEFCNRLLPFVHKHGRLSGVVGYG